MLENFLSSISSPKLAKITFEFVWEEFSGGDISTIADFEAWKGVDDTLCALADRLPNRTGSDPFTVVLSVRTAAGANLEGVNMGAFLEQFNERGIVTIVPFKGFLQPVSPHSPGKRAT